MRAVDFHPNPTHLAGDLQPNEWARDNHRDARGKHPEQGITIVMLVGKGIMYCDSDIGLEARGYKFIKDVIGQMTHLS